MSKLKSDAFAAIAAMDPDQENAERLAGLEKPQSPLFTAPVLPLHAPSAETICPACDGMRSEQDLAAALILARAAHAPFLENHAPLLETHRAGIELRSFEWRLRPAKDWQPVTLPHYGGPMGRHTAEYRTTFELPAAVRVKEAQILRFTGVDYKAHVFINGIFLGSHEGFFAPFEFDLTPHLQPGANELLVLVENDAITRGNQSWHQDTEGEKLYAATFIGWDEPELAWHHGPPGMGIWGSVWIEGRSHTHLGDLFVRPLVAENRAELWFEIFHTSADYAVDHSLEFSIFGRNFPEIRCERVPLGCPPRLGPNRNVLKFAIPFADARLWSPETPWLYQLQATLLRGGKPIDSMECQFGMRSFHINETSEPKGKIFLNGRAIKLRGANTMGFEQLAAMRGDWQRVIDDILLAKVCGMNFWRFTQRPVQGGIYDLCDRLGLMAQTDLPHFGTVRQTQFAESVRQSEEMERLIRSHPSCVLVSYINEPFPEAWHRNGHRHLARHDLENLFIACTHAIHLHNPDRMVKPIDGDYDPPGPGIADTHCYNGWYQWDRLPLGALNKGLWHATKPGWHTGCGEFGAEGLDPADLMRRRCPAEWLTPDPVTGWNPGRISHCQTGRHQPMWFEGPGAFAPLEVSESAPVLVAAADSLREGDLEKLVALARAGRRVILDGLPVGTHRIGDEEIQIVATANGPRHAACRNTGHPLVAGFAPNDFRFWFDPEAGHFAPIHDSTFLSDQWTPIVKTATGKPKTSDLDIPSEAWYHPSHVVAEKLLGRGSMVVSLLHLGRFAATSPVARTFARRICQMAGR